MTTVEVSRGSFEGAVSGEDTTVGFGCNGLAAHESACSTARALSSGSSRPVTSSCAMPTEVVTNRAVAHPSPVSIPYVMHIYMDRVSCHICGKCPAQN